MADPKTILVTGATGQQGGATAHELLKSGFRVKAMTRKPESEKAQALKKAGAEIIQGDLNDVASLEKALNGVWSVFAVQNTWEAGVDGEEEQGKRIAELAKKAGVQHFVYTSVASAHRNTGIPHFENKWRIEQKVRELNFPSHVILRPVFFMDNLISPWFKPYIDQGTLAVGIKPITSLQMIAVTDIGKYGLLAFQKAAELNGQAIDIAGDALTMPEAAAILSKVIGKPINFYSVPIEEVRKASDDFATMLEWFDRVGYDADISGNTKKYNIAPMPFEQWAKAQKWS